MIDWFSSYSAEWHVMHVNPTTWSPDWELTGCTSLSISRDCDTDKLESCSLEVDADAASSFEEGWYRIQMVATQGSSYELVDVATMLLESNSGKLNYSRNTISVDGVSVLQPAADMKLKIGDYAGRGDNGAEYAARLLRECIIPQVFVEGDGFVLDEYVVFDEGMSYLEAAWEILDCAGWVMRIAGDGTVWICGKPDYPVIQLDSRSAKIDPGVSYSRDLSSVPNRYYAVDDTGESAEAVNDNPASRTSYQARGRYIDVIDTSPQPINNEGLKGYVVRRLAEESLVYEIYTYTRPYQPDVWLFDQVYANMPAEGFVGLMRIMTQNISIGSAVKVQEKAGFELKEYLG